MKSFAKTAAGRSLAVLLSLSLVGPGLALPVWAEETDPAEETVAEAAWGDEDQTSNEAAENAQVNEDATDEDTASSEEAALSTDEEAASSEEASPSLVEEGEDEAAEEVIDEASSETESSEAESSEAEASEAEASGDESAEGEASGDESAEGEAGDQELDPQFAAVTPIWYEIPTEQINSAGSKAHADSEANLTRYWGDGALDTMQAVLSADNTYASGRGGKAILATSKGYWDALAASGFAGLMDAPIIITDRYQLSTQAVSELNRLKPSEVYVMGGPAAVSNDVYASVQTGGFQMHRIYGDDAVDTAFEIYRSGSSWGSTAIIATASGYWDALSIAPYAWRSKSPVFLADINGTLPDYVVSSISEGGFSRVIIVGGEKVVSPKVEDQVRTAGVREVKRLAGQNAIETSAEIAKWEIQSEHMSAEHISVATINGHWDALSAAPVCGRQGSVLVLAGANDMRAVQAVHDMAPAGSFAHVHVLGGEQALPRSVWDWLLANGKQK